MTHALHTLLEMPSVSRGGAPNRMTRALHALLEVPSVSRGGGS